MGENDRSTIEALIQRLTDETDAGALNWGRIEGIVFTTTPHGDVVELRLSRADGSFMIRQISPTGEIIESRIVKPNSPLASMVAALYSRVFVAGVPDVSLRINKPDRRVATAPPSSVVDTRVIYFGDSLSLLSQIPDESVDFVYCDPPYAHLDSDVLWPWQSFAAIGLRDEKDARSLSALWEVLKPLLAQARRVLSNTALLAFQCDPRFSHHVRIMLDEVFGSDCFVNEIVWQRSKRGYPSSRRLPQVHETILIYAKGAKYQLNVVRSEADMAEALEVYRHVEPSTGRRYKLDSLLASSPDKGYEYAFLGIFRRWRFTRERMDELQQEGQIIQFRADRAPRLKRYLDKQRGWGLGTIWSDVPESTKWRGYPTAKPLELLKRLVELCSTENAIVLDPFCGSGATLVAAELLGRQWIGMDMSPLACRLAANFMREAAGLVESEELRGQGIGFVLRAPDRGASELNVDAMPPAEFEAWALIMLGAIPSQMSSADAGIDGRIVIEGSDREERKVYAVQVKATKSPRMEDVDFLDRALAKNNLQRGVLVVITATPQMQEEAELISRRTDRQIILVTPHDLITGRWRSAL